MIKFNLKHIALIFITIISTGISLLWFFHAYLPNPWPNSEFYLLLAIYFISIISTALIYRTNQVLILHKAIGFNRCHYKFIIVALLGSLAIWLFDYLLQVHLFKVDIKSDALQWYKNNQQLIPALATTVILAPVIEEMLFRGILLKTVKKYLSRFWSALIISALFALVHYDPFQAISLFTASLFYVWLTYKSGSIIPAVIAHILNNCLAFIFYLSSIETFA